MLGVLGVLEYEDGELAEASEDCRGLRESLRWAYTILADDGPAGMAMEDDMAMVFSGRGGWNKLSWKLCPKY